MSVEQHLSSIDKKLLVLQTQNINKQALDAIFNNIKKVASSEISLRVSIARLDSVVKALDISALYSHLEEALKLAQITRVSDTQCIEYFEIFDVEIDEDVEQDSLATKVISESPAYVFLLGFEGETLILKGTAKRILDRSINLHTGNGPITKDTNNFKPDKNSAISHVKAFLVTKLGIPIISLAKEIYNDLSGAIKIFLPRNNTPQTIKKDE